MAQAGAGSSCQNGFLFGAGVRAKRKADVRGSAPLQLAMTRKVVLDARFLLAVEGGLTSKRSTRLPIDPVKPERRDLPGAISVLPARGEAGSSDEISREDGFGSATKMVAFCTV